MTTHIGVFHVREYRFEAAIRSGHAATTGFRHRAERVAAMVAWKRVLTATLVSIYPMPEPLFGAAFFVGILGNLLARHIDPAEKSAAEAIFVRLTGGGPELPPNHDLDRVCRASLRQALELMAQSMDIHVAAPKTLQEAFQQRFDAQGKWKPMVDWWHTSEREWFVTLVAAIASDEALADFNLRWIKGATSLNDPLRSKANPALEKLFSDALLAWVDRHVQKGKRPAFFDSWVREGWPVAQDSPTVRISIFPAWCLFLQHHFKEDQKVRAILNADWLTSIDDRLRNFHIDSAEIFTALQQPLGEQLEMLTELHAQVHSLTNGFTVLGERTGQLLALVLEFRSEVGMGFAGVRAQLAAFEAGVSAAATAAQAANRKLDTALLNDATIISKLDLLFAERRHPSAMLAEAQLVSIPKRIADSRLLASDGAARLRKLVGRASEKGLLTRAWCGDATRILSFVAWGGSGKTSIVVDWLKEHLKSQWQGVDAFFDWSFYSQGTKDQSGASSDAFFNAALQHFGEEAFANSPAPVEEKAARLVMQMKKQRTLLVLDGLEPLQHPRKPGQHEGRLKDNGLARLLRLVAQSQGPMLCVITTRVPVVDVHSLLGSTVQEIALDHLSVRYGAELLYLAGARFAGAKEIEEDDRELRDAAKEVAGHAMTLQLLGGYLRSAQEGDIRRRNRVNFEKAFDNQLEGHAYNVMEAYEKWFEAEGERGTRQLGVLRMVGLFDRIVDAGCIDALRRDGGISGVSDAVAALGEADWNETLKHLGDHHLVSVNRDTRALDAHPLLREYFARRLCERNPEAWRAAHRRLYEHLCASTQEGDAPTLEELQPLYQAVAHGCLAGLQQEACNKVYFARISKENESYVERKLGAFGSELAAVSLFFEIPWSRVSPALSEDDQTWLLNRAAFRLRALGRGIEAREPMRAAANRAVSNKKWKHASVATGNLSELEWMLGEVATAIHYAEQAAVLAERSADAFQKMTRRVSHACALHHAGRRSEAESLFREAEQMQKIRQPSYPILYSVQGLRYCEFLLAPVERAIWVMTLTQKFLTGDQKLQWTKVCRDAAQRAAMTIEWVAPEKWLLDLALGHLILGRSAFYSCMLDESGVRNAKTQIDNGVAGLRGSGNMDELPKALLLRAWCISTEAIAQKLNGDPAEADRLVGRVQDDLDEAWEIAERGSMKLHMADIHLHRARLFFRNSWYPWGAAAADLAAAEKLIDQCGYHLRDGELAETKQAILGV